MIISKTPYRISFFGGGTDYPSWYMKHGGEVISSTIDKSIYISCRKLPNFFEHKFRLVYGKVENVKAISKIQHIAIKGILNKFNRKYTINDGLEIHYDGELPARSGMGSSSSFIVGLLNTLNHFYGKNLSKKKLAEESIYFERDFLKETVGSQDQVAAALGGFNSIKFDRNGKFIVKKIFKNKKIIENFSKNFFIVYTKINRTAKVVADTYVKSLVKDKEKDMFAVMKHVEIAKKLLKKNQFDEFGLLLNETWNIKKRLSKKVSNSYIDFLYAKGIKSGAIGGKLLGAGGGGFVLFYVPKNNQSKFKKLMLNHIVFPVNFTTSGSEIVYKNV